MTKVCFNQNSFLFFIIVLLILATVTAAFAFKDTPLPEPIKKAEKVIQEVIKTVKEVPERIKRNVQFPDKRYAIRGEPPVSQQVGFIFTSDLRFPLWETRHYSDYYYHTLDDSRVGIKIPIESPKKDQFYDGQEISVPELSDELFTIKLYEYKSNLNFTRPNYF